MKFSEVQVVLASSIVPSQHEEEVSESSVKDGWVFGNPGEDDIGVRSGHFKNFLLIFIYYKYEIIIKFISLKYNRNTL